MLLIGGRVGLVERSRSGLCSQRGIMSRAMPTLLLEKCARPLEEEWRDF